MRADTFGIPQHRHHVGFIAAMVHRISGLILALFLPLHFLALGLALENSRFAAFIAWSDAPLVKLSEFALVTALAVHMAGGLRVLAIEFFGCPVGTGTWITSAFCVGAGTGLLFLMSAFS